MKIAFDIKMLAKKSPAARNVVTHFLGRALRGYPKPDPSHVYVWCGPHSACVTQLIGA